MRAPTPVPPSAALEALLKHERTPPGQPDMVRARAVARARATLREVPPAALVVRPTWTTGRLLAAATAGIVVAGGIVAALYSRQPAAPPVRPVPVAVSVAPPAPETAPVAEDTAPREAASPPVAPLARPKNHPQTIGKRDSLTDEVQLLTRARQADTRGDYADVMALIARHERAHPDGRLIEEREVLRVKALVGLGRAAEARAAVARFRHDFPHSVLLGRVNEMQAALP